MMYIDPHACIEKKVMKMLSSIKNPNRMFLTQDIVLIIIKFFLKFVWVSEKEQIREGNIYYLK